jgi:predicted dehydrogenase
MEKIKYGILGCGKHALVSHAIPSKDLGNLELIAVYDISDKQLDYFENAYGKKLNKFKDKDEFLHSGIDAVFIGTPDEFHFGNLQEAINENKHVFVEKPLITKVREVKGLKEVLEVADEKSIIVSSCHPRRYDPPFLWLKSNLGTIIEKLGNPLSFSFDFSYHKPSKDWKHSRGLLLDHANHEIDLVSYLFGHSGFLVTKLSDSYDRYKVVGKRTDGIDFSFSGTRRLESRNYLEWALIRFERGDLLLDASKGAVRLQDHESKLVQEISIGKTDYEERGRKTMINFSNAIRNVEPCYLSHRDLYMNNALSVMLSENDTWRYDNGRSD